MNKKKSFIKYLFIISLLLIIFYFLVGYVSSYIGYFVYNKHNIRRYTSSLIESKERNVFVKKLNYSICNDIEIKNVFIEKGFRWGSSDKKTKVFKDSLNFPYQIIFDYKEKQGKYLVYIPDNRKLIKNKSINDTLQFKIYLRDFDNKLVKEVFIKIWE